VHEEKNMAVIETVNQRLREDKEVQGRAIYYEK